MEKEIRQKPKYKQVADGFSDIEVFVTRDGKEYKKEEDALKHEATLISWENFCKKYQYSKFEMDTWYEVIVVKEPTEETRLEIVMRWSDLYSARIRPGINMIVTDDSGDYTSHSLYFPEDMIKEKQSEIKQLEELIESKSVKC